MKASDIPIRMQKPFAGDAVAPYITYPLPVNPTGIPGQASLDGGFPPETFVQRAQGGTPPSGADANGILFWVSAWARFVSQSGGPVPFSSTYSTEIGGYPLGATIPRVDNLGWWQSWANDNTANPESGGANWLLVNSNLVVFLDGGTVNLTTLDSSKNYVGRAATTIFLPVATSVPVGTCYGFACRTAAVVVTPDGAAGIDGAADGLSYQFPVQTGGLLIRDPDANWSIFYYSAPSVGIYVTSNLVLRAGYRYLTDSRMGPFTLTLPSVGVSPEIIIIEDVGHALDQYPVTMARAGSDTIMGIADNCLLDVPGIQFTMTNDGGTTDGTNWKFD